MSQMFYTQVPSIHSHAHFANEHIESFPDLHAHETFQQKNRRIKEHLKYQLLTTRPEDAKNFVNMRECFKLSQKHQVEFCLKEKVPGTSFLEAATKLGYVKHH